MNYQNIDLHELNSYKYKSLIKWLAFGLQWIS